MADIPNRKYYAKIADQNARATYPPSVEDPQPPVNPVNPVGPETFLELTDTPNSYAGQAGKLVGVNNAENALTFLTGVPFPDGVVVVGSAVQAGNDILYGTDWIWRINQVLYSLSSASNISFPVSASGQIRRDIVVGNSSGGISRVAGAPVVDTEPAIPPNVPANTVLLQEILITDLGIDTVTNAALATFVRFDIPTQGLSSIQRQNARTNIEAVRRDGPDIIRLNDTGTGSRGWEFIDKDGLPNFFIIQYNSGSQTLVRLNMNNQAGIMVMRLMNGTPQTNLGSDSPRFYLRGAGINTRTLVTWDDANGEYVFSMLDSGLSRFAKVSPMHPRSGIGSGMAGLVVSEQSTRRDELPIIYPTTITATGKVNDVDLNVINGSIRFSSGVTSVSGIDAKGDSKVIYISTENTAGIWLNAQDTDSIAANRFLQAIYVPYREYVPIAYLAQVSRWVRVVQNRNNDSVILNSPDGNKWQISVDNSGAVITTMM